MGIAGPDREAGGRYLVLPPGYEGDVPDGYFVRRTPTFTNRVVFRALGVVPALPRTRVDALADAAAPPAMESVSFADLESRWLAAFTGGSYESLRDGPRPGRCGRPTTRARA